jgi:hypothetical protein
MSTDTRTLTQLRFSSITRRFTIFKTSPLCLFPFLVRPETVDTVPHIITTAQGAGTLTAATGWLLARNVIIPRKMSFIIEQLF